MSAVRENVGEAFMQSESDEVRLRAVVDTAVDGVILIDARGSILMFNPACEKLFGYARAEVIGQNVKMLMPPPYREEHDTYLENYHRTRRAKIIGIGREVTGRRKDGTTFPMDLSVGEAKDENGSVFVGVIHSLSERKRIEAQLAQAQKMEAVGQLSGGIAHDFNNLLTVIIGNADTLSERLKSRPDLARLADQIVSAGQRGADLTQRLLAYSRRQMLQPAEVDCNALIETLREMLRRTMREDIEIRTELDPVLNAAYADPAQLEAAILNLALNAQDAMPEGGCLTITTMNVPLDERYRDIHPEVPPGHYVMIAVTDDGLGMPKEVRDRAFEPFFTTKEVGKGSGLGLSMVYGFAKQSNGHVSLYSEPDLGTTIRIYLPASSAVPIREETQSDAELPHGHGVVLVAEDDPVVRGYAVSCLESLGYRALATKDGNEALEVLRREPEITVLFSDVVMPGGLTGWDLAERARELRPDLKILLTSGYAIESLASRGRINPEFAVLNKPYRKVELARRLRAVLDPPR